MSTEEPQKPENATAEAAVKQAVESVSVSRTTTTELTAVTATETTGRRQVFGDIRRQLAEEDLSSKGVQKLLLSELETSEGECESLRSYIQRYHEADKRAAVFEERLKTNTATEIMFAVGLAVGGALLGWAPALWDSGSKGAVAVGFGVALIAGSAAAKALRK